MKLLGLRWEMTLEAGFVLIRELSRVTFYPHLYGSFWWPPEHGVKWESKTLVVLKHADDLSILNENVSKMNELLEVLRVRRSKNMFEK